MRGSANLTLLEHTFDGKPKSKIPWAASARLVVELVGVGYWPMRPSIRYRDRSA